jgi:hypothetical protein
MAQINTQQGGINAIEAVTFIEICWEWVLAIPGN